MSLRQFDDWTLLNLHSLHQSYLISPYGIHPSFCRISCPLKSYVGLRKTGDPKQTIAFVAAKLFIPLLELKLVASVNVYDTTIDANARR